MDPETPFRFGPFEFDFAKKLLLCGKDQLHVTRKPLRALVYVLKHRNRLVSYEDLIGAIWGDPEDKTKDTTEGKTSDDVRKTVRKCFKSLNHQGHVFIETVHQHGYRFVYLPGETPPPVDTEHVRTLRDRATEPNVESLSTTEDGRDGGESRRRRSPPLESNSGVLPTSVLPATLSSHGNLEKRVENLERVVWPFRRDGDSPMQSFPDHAVELGMRPAIVCLKHRTTARKKYYVEAFSSRTTVYYLSIMSKTQLENINPLLEVARETKTKLCVMTWDENVSVAVVEALRVHLNENNENPALTVRQVKQAALAWHDIENKYKGTVEVRYYSSCPTLQGLIVENSWAIIEMLPFQTNTMERPALILTPNGDPELFQLFSEKWEQLWNTAKRWRSRRHSQS